MLPITVHQVKLHGKPRHFVFSKRPLSAVILRAYLKFEKADPPIATLVKDGCIDPQSTYLTL